MRIRRGVLKRRLERVLTKNMGKQISVKNIKDLREVPAPSRTFNVAKLTVIYNNGEPENKELRLILKRLKPDYKGTDFSNINSGIHKSLENPLSYTKNLFEYLQGPISNGEEGALVRFYGQDGRDIFEEDANDISVEKLFIEKTPDPNLLERIINILAIEHFRWSEKIGSNIDKLVEIHKQENFSKKLEYNMDVILKNKGKEIIGVDREVLKTLFNEIEAYLTNPNFNIYFKLIHSDLHLGHTYLRYGGLELNDILSMDKKELRKLDPKIKIIDVTGMSIGPQTFDLVDILKHPAAVNPDEYMTEDTQRKFVESLVEKYRAKTFEVLSSKYEFKNGSGKIKKSLDFLALFYISNIYRDIRAKAKSILLQSKHKELYSIYTQLNPKYNLYAPWYLADLGQTLRYLILNRDFEGIFKEDSSINKNLLEQSYDILRKTVEGIGDINPIGLSKQIIKN